MVIADDHSNLRHRDVVQFTVPFAYHPCDAAVPIRLITPFTTNVLVVEVILTRKMQVKLQQT